MDLIMINNTLKFTNYVVGQWKFSYLDFLLKMFNAWEYSWDTKKNYLNIIHKPHRGMVQNEVYTLSLVPKITDNWFEKNWKNGGFMSVLL